MTDQSLLPVRHGETAFCADGRLRRLADADPNAAGLDRANRWLRSRIGRSSIIVSSPLLRAVRTAAIIAQSCETEHKVHIRLKPDYRRWKRYPDPICNVLATVLLTRSELAGRPVAPTETPACQFVYTYPKRCGRPRRAVLLSALDDRCVGRVASGPTAAIRPDAYMLIAVLAVVIATA